MFFIIRKIINLKINFYGLEDCHFSPNIFFSLLSVPSAHYFFFKDYIREIILESFDARGK